MGRCSLLAVIVLAAGLVACGGGDAPSEAEPPEQSAPVSWPDTPFPFEGRWANAFTDCTLEPGSIEEAPIQIMRGRLVSFDNICALSDVVELDSAGRFEAARRCSAAGASYDDTVLFRVSGDTLMMQTDVGSIAWTRCPDIPQGD